MDIIKNKEGLELGPTYLEFITIRIEPSLGFENIEWRAKLKMKCKQIKYFGDIISSTKTHKTYISEKNLLGPVVKVIDVNNDEIILFDEYIHGYDGVMGNYDYSEKELDSRQPDQNFFSEDKEPFEVVLSALYTTNYEGWLSEDDEFDEMGRFKIKEGLYIDFIELKRNSYNFFQISIIEKNGDTYTILERETT